jgi:GntR family transcriptional repressor for pyruvate dehydrogenase complex
MNVSLKPIKPKRISDQVYEQIRELIFRGQLKPGQQLMPERDLSEALAVSRTTVRNAINKLVVMGLLEHKQGQGTFVRSPETWRQGNPLAMAMESQDASLQDLLEVRLGLECNAAALAAERALESDLEILATSVAEMEEEINQGGLGVDADTSFHMAIAFATKNPFHVYIMKNFYDLLFVGIKKNLMGLYEEPENHRLILSQHQAVFESIRRRDPSSAAEAMDRHIHFVMDFFKKRQGA